MSRLAYRYLDGKGVPKDDQKAIEWFRKSGDLNPELTIKMHRDKDSQKLMNGIHDSMRKLGKIEQQMFDSKLNY